MLTDKVNPLVLLLGFPEMDSFTQPQLNSPLKDVYSVSINTKTYSYIYRDLSAISYFINNKWKIRGTNV